MNTAPPLNTLRLASRTSPLARVQVQELKELLQGLSFDPVWLESFGDKNKTLSLWEPQAPDFFTRELDQALREDRADAAVHSAKDLPCPLPEDLEVWALTPRQESRDALVLSPDLEKKLLTTLKQGETLTLSRLPAGTRIGTSSPSRRSQLESLRPDCPLVSIRGDIAGRLAYLDRGEADGIVVAACALDRLGWTGKISLYLDLETHPLQGHLAVVGLRSRPGLAAVFQKADVRRNWGTVWIAGAGPGDPRLLTLQVKDLIARADVILHDALGAPSVLEEARGELIFVGKRRGKHEMTQDQTNALLHRLALEGKTVLRLKGGDPFIFGRGSEELDYLKSRLVDARVVPGISSALGAAAAFGLPLTERGISRSVAFCTGWPEDQIQAPAADTLVYFMGAGSLGTLARKNREAGKPGSTPVALISNATLPDQDIRFLTLEDLEKPLTEINTLPTPVLVILGETARQDRSWFTPRRPGVLWYTGTDWEIPPRSSFPEELKVLHHPLITFSPPEDPEPWNRVMEELVRRSKLQVNGESPVWHWIIFTSRQTVKVFFQALEMQGGDARSLAGVRIAAVGQATGRALLSRGLRADLIPATETAEALGSLFPPAPAGPAAEDDLPGTDLPRILLPSSQLAPPRLAEILRDKGWKVERFTAYTTREASGPEFLPAGLREVHFTSPSTVTSFFRQYGTLPPGVRAVCRGPSTEKALAQVLGSGYALPIPCPESPMPELSPFRRFHPLRATAEVREENAEVSLKPRDLILPLFVIPGTDLKVPIPSLADTFRWSPDRVSEPVSEALAAGVDKFLLFGVPDRGDKNEAGTGAWDAEGPVCRALKTLNETFPQAVLMTDVCLCAYTAHGHCGHLDSAGGVDNDRTLPDLGRMALAHARAGAHWVAPSAMMDGQVAVIRQALDREGFSQVKVLGYSAKFASRLYGPFRDAAGSAPARGDRKSYQMDFRTRDQALAEVAADLEEGAAGVMVKPAHWYQDILARVRAAHPQALQAAYQVSGEYMMIRHGAAAGLFSFEEGLEEALFALRRSGADWIITYGAAAAARRMQESRP